ncbi:FecR domain-containing protein [Desulfococcaceae bacterium HSG8]|nr:FecR domain-containing protein [Desulfococcaceae bacterium HSG8]
MTKKRKRFFWLRLSLFLLYLLTPVIIIVLHLPSVILEKIVITSQNTDIPTALIITRAGKRLDVEEGMKLKPGDKIENYGETKIEISISAIQLTIQSNIILKEVRVLLNKNTKIEILDTAFQLLKPESSVILQEGDIYVKTRRYPFSVETKYVRAGTRGTEFLVKAEPKKNNRVTIIVSEKIILLKSKTDAWEPVELVAPVRTIIVGEGSPRKSSITPDQIEEEFKWIRDIQRIATSKELFWNYPFAGLFSDWYIRIRMNTLMKKEDTHRAFHDKYTDDLSELNFDPGPLSIEFTTVSNNFFEAQVTYSGIPGYIWIIDSEGNTGFFKDPEQNFSETKISLLRIILFVVFFFLIAKFIRYRLRK